MATKVRHKKSGTTYLFLGTGYGAFKAMAMANTLHAMNPEIDEGEMGMIAVCEGLLYAHKVGLDIPTVLKSVSSGAAGSWSLSNLAPRMINGDFDPGFFVEHFLKDMKIALDEASKRNLALPGLALGYQLYHAVAAQGHRRDGTQSLILALAKLNGFDWKNENR